MPCQPISFASPTGPSGPAIPGFGIPYSINISPIKFPPGFPEDLLDIFDNLQALIPPGLLKPALNPNFGKDIFDGIMKLLDQFMPFLMLYKFFLPILNLIICIIEVLCALVNPFALVAALDRLFTQCIPAFLNLFPIFALILMIISLILLLIQLIEYIVLKIVEFILALLRNINALVLAFQESNAVGVLAIANKLGSLMCIFQNLFVLLAFFEIIIQAIKDMLSLIFAIPPCEGGDNSNCCSPQTCPVIVQNKYTRDTGTLQYLPEVGYETTIALGSGFLTSDLRSESWQLYDAEQNIAQAFWNIVDGYDVVAQYNQDGYALPVPVFFPTTATYSATTAPSQAAYTVDLTLDYDPSQWGRAGNKQTIKFTDCIVLYAPLQTLEDYQNNASFIPVNPDNIETGVFFLAGGIGSMANGQQLDGYAPDGITGLSGVPATLENFLHKKAAFSATPILSPSDTINLNVKYTFKPNLPTLMQANLVTLGCQPSVAFNRAFVNNVVYSNIATQTANLTSLVNGPTFPAPGAAQQCLLAAMDALRSNMTIKGVSEFQITANLCLSKLQNDCNTSLTSVIGIGYSPCNSNFALSPSIQFSTLPIAITVNLNENNGLPISSNIPASIGAELAAQITAYPTFGEVSEFTYDGYKSFNALLTSGVSGSGSIMIAFQNQILCTNTMPAGGTPTHTLQALDYEFVYIQTNVKTGEGDTLGEPRRDVEDIGD